MKTVIIVIFCLILILMLIYFGTLSHVNKNVDKKIESTTTEQQDISGSISSSSFDTGTLIPKKYTCDGDNTSPELNWRFNETDPIRSYVLIVDDPDAQSVVGHTVVHWALLLPSSITQLPAHLSGKDQAPITEFNHSIKALNTTYQTPYYQGPCPPKTSEAHTYNFTIFALNTSIEHAYQLIQNKTYTAEEFNRDMDAYILKSALLQGIYSRK